MSKYDKGTRVESQGVYQPLHCYSTLHVRYNAYWHKVAVVYLSPDFSFRKVTEYWTEAQPRSNILSPSEN